MKKILLLAFSTLLLASCGNREKEIGLHFELTSDASYHTVGDTLFKGDTAIAFDLFHLYLSDLSLNGAVVEPVWFINTSDTATTSIKLPLKKTATSFSLGLGLNETQNASDPTSFETTHPLSSAKAMYWSWASKYRFVKADGRVNHTGQLGSGDLSLIWHTGLDTLYRTRSYDLTIEPGDELYVTLDLDALISALSMERQVFTHTDVTTYDVAEAVTNEMIQSIGVEVR